LRFFPVKRLALKDAGGTPEEQGMVASCVYPDMERPSDLGKLDNAERFLGAHRDRLICIDCRRPLCGGLAVKNGHCQWYRRKIIEGKVGNHGNQFSHKGKTGEDSDPGRKVGFVHCICIC